jgi:hypothetical protein
MSRTITKFVGGLRNWVPKKVRRIMAQAGTKGDKGHQQGGRHRWAGKLRFTKRR